MKSHNRLGTAPGLVESLQALVLYDEADTAKEAKRLCDRLAVNTCAIEPTFWSFDILRFPQLLPVVSQSAHRATVLIIAADGQRPLPAWVKTLVSLFWYSKGPGEGAVVAMLRLPIDNKRYHSPVYSYLKQTAENTGVAFFSKVLALDSPRDGSLERADGRRGFANQSCAESALYSNRFTANDPE